MAHVINNHPAVVFPLPVPDPSVPPALRLSLAPGPARRRSLDGGWWPRSRDATAELAELVAGLTGPLGMVTRMTVDLHDWDHVPRRIAVGGRAVKVGWFPNLDHMVIVTCGRTEEFLLLVIPPDAPESSARVALDRSASGIDGARPLEILAACDISTARTPETDVESRPTTPHSLDVGDKLAVRPVPAEPSGPHAPTPTDGPVLDEPMEIGRWFDDGAWRDSAHR